MIKADRLFIQNLNRIKNEGIWDENPRPKYKDGTSAHSKFISPVVMEYDISNNEFPITNLRPIAVKMGVKEIMAFYQDQTSDLSVLREKHGIKWWDEFEVGDSNNIGIRYGATVKRYDLMNKLLYGLKYNPFGRRHIISLYQEADFEDSDGLYPCAFLTMWTIRKVNDVMFLDCSLIQRSSDCGTALHINQSQYVALQMMIAKHCSYQVGKFIHFIQNMHYYDRHENSINELLSRTPSDIQPKFILNVPDGTNFYDIKVDDFEIVDYHPIKPQLKFELAI